MPLDPEKLRAAIKKAGYQTRDLEVVMRAEVGRSGERFELKPEGTPQTFFVRGSEAAKQLDPWIGKVVRVKGKITAEAPRLELDLLEVGPAGG